MAEVRTAAAVELHENRRGAVGAVGIRRGLPRRARRTVGAWCLADHMGPADFAEDEGVDIGPHPHIGLQTVTWLLDGEILHKDSLGSEQVVRAGQLNLMTAGRGIAHSEEKTGRYRGPLEGVQLWVAQPDATRDGPAAFEHHPALPQTELDGLGCAVATVFVGDFAGVSSSARRDTEHFGADLELGRASWADLPVRRHHEHALVVLRGAMEIEGALAPEGTLAYLPPGTDEVRVRAHDRARALLLGGVPLDRPPLMWWNFVARTPSEIDAARAAWDAGDGRFGEVSSVLARTPAPERAP